MALIEWTETLGVGNEVLDAHHRHLIELLNRLHGVIHAADASITVGQVLDDLVAYVGYHFTEEERMMEASGFPDLTAHQFSHAQLTKAVGEMICDYDGNPHFVMAAELFEFLSEWLLRHIRVEDMAYKPWLSR